MKTVPCSNCGSIKCVPYDTENGFTLVKCQGCGLLYLNPCPSGEEIRKAAKTGTHAGITVLDVTGHYIPTKKAKFLRVLAALFKGEIPVGSWLDVGCGHGEFLDALREFAGEGLHLKGAEPNEAKANSARARGLDVDDIVFPCYEGKYDFISLLNVYSHLPNPSATLEEWSKRLKFGGQLIIETGDTSNLPSWRHPKPYSLPDHLSFASEEILKSMLKRLGFTVLETTRRPLYDRLNPIYVARQIVKVVIPGKRANLGWLPWNPRRDLWIRARRSS